MWQPEKPKVSWIEWAFLVFVIVGSLIGIVYTLVSVDLVDIGGGESIPQPTGAVATPVATRSVVAPTDAPMPANTPVVVSTALLPTRQPLVVRETTQPGWLAVSSEPTSHKLQGLDLEIRCSGLGPNKLLMLVDGDEKAAISYRDLILIQQGQDSTYLTVDQKCGIQWLDGNPDPSYATFHISRDGDEVSWGYNPDPEPYSIGGK